MTAPLTENLLNAISFRCIGPPRGGRVVAVAGDPTNPALYYFGAVAGGVWKTDDAGTTWLNISDGYFKTSSVGALTVSQSDPNVIYAGMGETTIRTDVSYGDGVYKSTDGGKTWAHCGLTDTRHIGEIRVHPKNPDLVYVAALGHAFGQNEERGVFRSKDGGKSWEKVLYKSDKAGAVDISFDPRNPDILYASIWETYRTFWELSSGGPDSGLWKSTDGGDTWTEITHNKGLLPDDAIVGKIGIAASPVQAGRVWALVESDKEPGLYRSEDFGETWSFMTDKQDLRYRPWYYMHIFADPQDAGTVYVNNLGLWKSTDGGKNFDRIATPHGDNHDLWIDPGNNQRMIQSNDGGANISFNGGASWSTIYNQLTAQFYHVATDNQEPFYRVYGTQQDNSSISVPSSTTEGAIVWGDCYPAGTGESGYIAVHPDDSDIVYVGAVGSSPGGGGALQRYDHKSGQIQLVNVWPEMHGGIGPVELKYRFPWTFPIHFSPHDPDVIYTTGNVVFRSNNEGNSWEPISPDLTRNDPDKLQASGGPISKDTSGAEHYCTIASFCESPLQKGLLWSASDDGLVYLSKDDGTNWENVTPPELPEWSQIWTIDPSPHDAGTLYIAATRYKLDDTAPYLFKTDDYGATWTKIVDGIPSDDYTRVIRTDVTCPGLLFAGTETGLYVSMNDGESWQRWTSNFPVTPIFDMVVKGTDLVIGTHGRAFWIVDDLTPLHQVMQSQSGEGNHLFAPRKTWRIVPDLFDAWTSSDGKDYTIGLGKAVTFTAQKSDTGHVERTILDAGTGAPNGAIVYYNLAEALTADADARLRFLDSAGNLIREFRPKPDGYDKLDDKDKALNPGPWMGTLKGVNRFVWDLRYSGATKVRGNKLAGEANIGPIAVPGTYTVELTVGGSSQSATFEVVNDPRRAVSQADLEAQLDLLLSIRDKISQAHEGINQLRKVNTQVVFWQEQLTEREDASAVVEAAKALEAKLAEVEDLLILPGEQEDTFGLNERTRLHEKLSSLISIIGSADAKPTKQAQELAAHYSGEIDQQLETLSEILEGEVASFNAMVRDASLPAIG